MYNIDKIFIVRYDKLFSHTRKLYYFKYNIHNNSNEHRQVEYYKYLDKTPIHHYINALTTMVYKILRFLHVQHAIHEIYLQYY